MAKKELQIQVKEKNTKTRKGLYLSIKAKGTKERLYKLTDKKGNMQREIVDILSRYYKDKYIAKKTAGTLKYYKTTWAERQWKEKDKYKGVRRIQRATLQTKKRQQAFLKKIKKQPSIKEIFTAGKTTAKIEDVMKIDQMKLKQKKEELLKPLVRDKTLLKILLQDSNMQKYMTKLAYQIEIKGTKKEKIGTTQTINQIPDEIISKLQGIVKSYKGQEVKEEGDYQWDWMKQLIEQLKLGLYKHEKDGYLKTIGVTIEFRVSK